MTLVEGLAAPLWNVETTNSVINQQVNLFQPMFRKERKLLSFRVLLQACAVVFVLLVSMYGYGMRQTAEMQADLSQLQGQLDRRVAQVEELATRLAQRKTDTSAAQELARLEQEMAARRRVVDALTRVRDTYTRGVSGYMESFARQAPKGVWLTGFVVQAGGEGLVIRGSALKPALVPSFIQRLTEETTLAGTHFGLLQIEREDTASRQVDFTLYTGSEPPPEPEEALP